MRRRLGFAILVCWGAAPGVSAQGVTLYGDARIGLGYNILNDGEPDLVEVEDAASGETAFEAAGDLRAISRVEFGVLLTGESESGIAFGAGLDAHDAEGGNDGTEGEAFVTGAFGTLVVGDADAADEARVGDAVEALSLTGLGDLNETPFVSNGGGFGNDAIQFADNPEARPTLRYDYDVGGFGVSLSTDRALRDVGLGARFILYLGREQAEEAANEDEEDEDEEDEARTGQIEVGVGFYDFAAFSTEGGDYIGPVDVPDGRQWSGGLQARYGDLAAGIVYTSIDAGGAGELDILTLGAAASIDAWEVAAYYAAAAGDRLVGEAFGGRDSFGVSAQRDLGGGASVAFGVAQTFGSDAVATRAGEAAPALDSVTVGDFGIALTF